MTEIKSEDMLKDIKKTLKSFNLLQMTTYMGVDPSIVNVWTMRGKLPYRNVKWIVEYIEMHTDDCVTLCWKLMEYYKQEEKKRADRLNETRERNRQRARERYKK